MQISTWKNTADYLIGRCRNASDEMIADVDRYIKGLRFGSEVLDLVSLDDKAFQVKMEELDAYFDTLKQEIDLVLQVGYENTNIIQKSETFFSLCDVATGKHMHKESQHA